MAKVHWFSERRKRQASWLFLGSVAFILLLLLFRSVLLQIIRVVLRGQQVV